MVTFTAHMQFLVYNLCFAFTCIKKLDTFWLKKSTPPTKNLLKTSNAINSD